jgi:exosortase
MFGATCLQRATFPVWLLALTVLPPRALAAAVTLDLQVFAAAAAGAVLRVFGVPFYQAGTTIELSALTLRVAEVCDGLRFLMGFLVLTAAVAQVTQRTLPRKIVLTASAIPIAIFANAARVAAIALGVHLIGPQAASGSIHDWIGKSAHVSALIPLAVLAIALARWPRPRRPSVEPEAASRPRTPSLCNASDQP